MLESFEKSFHEATSKVLKTKGKIHFNLDGFDIARSQTDRGKGLYEASGYTSWEFNQILDNPELFKTTEFYKDGATFSKENLKDLLKQ